VAAHLLLELAVAAVAELGEGLGVQVMAVAVAPK